MTLPSRRDWPSGRLNKLGFREHPFLLSADPRFLYLSNQHMAVLDRLRDLVDWREGLAVVVGPIGVGKTTIARRLYELYTLEQGYNVVYIHTAEYTTATEAARDIARAFGQPTRRALIDQLRDMERFLVEARSKNQNVIAIIDDAQQMRSDALDTLQSFFNFDVKAKLIQTILFAQPEIHMTFAAKPGVLDRVAAWQSLSPLPPDDALSMIQFRCQVAGRQEPLMSDSAFLRLYELTNGVPRPMVNISAELLRVILESGKMAADQEDIEQAIVLYQKRFGSEA